MEAPLGDSLGSTGCGAAQREGRREAHPGGLGRRAGGPISALPGIWWVGDELDSGLQTGPDKERWCLSPVSSRSPP